MRLVGRVEYKLRVGDYRVIVDIDENRRVIERMLEDLRKLSKETIADIEEARKEIESGRFVTHERKETDNMGAL